MCVYVWRGKFIIKLTTHCKKERKIHSKHRKINFEKKKVQAFEEKQIFYFKMSLRNMPVCVACTHDHDRIYLLHAYKNICIKIGVFRA